MNTERLHELCLKVLFKKCSYYLSLFCSILIDPLMFLALKVSHSLPQAKAGQGSWNEPLSIHSLSVGVECLMWRWQEKHDADASSMSVLCFLGIIVTLSHHSRLPSRCSPSPGQGWQLPLQPLSAPRAVCPKETAWGGQQSWGSHRAEAQPGLAMGRGCQGNPAQPHPGPGQNNSKPMTSW